MDLCHCNGRYVSSCTESLVCGDLRTPPHGSITIVEARPENLEVAYSCDVGYRRFGRKYRHCRQEYERWSGLRPGCYRKCPRAQFSVSVFETMRQNKEKNKANKIIKHRNRRWYFESTCTYTGTTLLTNNVIYRAYSSNIMRPVDGNNCFT